MLNTTKKIDDCLSIRDGHLFIEECDTVDLANRFGTPIYIISENQLQRNIHRYQKAFQKQWPEGNVNILPAIKANWTLATRRILTKEGAGCDCYSEGELHAALESGINPKLVSVNGGGKSEDHIRYCISKGVRITVDDIDELDIIEREANKLSKKATIRFRLRPNLSNLWKPSDFVYELVPIDLSVSVYKNGIPTEHVKELGRRALKMKNIEISGFHIHLGRHHGSIGYWRGQMRRYAKLMGELKKAWGGYEPREIDIGGGIPTPRDPFFKIVNRLDAPIFSLFFFLMLFLKIFGDKIRYKIMSILVSLFVKKPNQNHLPPIEAYAEGITNTLRKELKRQGIDTKGKTLEIEPGRSLYGDTGIHLAKVLKIKHQTKPVKYNWVLLNTTYFFLAGGVLEYNLHNFLTANKADKDPVKTADIVGKSCFADRILPEVRIPEIKSGDLIAFLDTGAYQEVSSSNFNGLPRPATILVKRDKAEIIKLAETIEDVFRRDVVPERLRKLSNSKKILTKQN